MSEKLETIEPKRLDDVSGGTGWRFQIPGLLNVALTNGNNKRVAQGNFAATTLADNQPLK